MTQIEALKLALEALTDALNKPMWNRVQMEAAITAIKAALEAKDKPVAWRYDQAKYRTNDLRGRQWAFNVFSQAKPYIDEMVQNVTPLYTTPPQRKPLTDEEIEDMWQQYCKQWKTGEKIVIQFVDFARAIEAAHGIKGEA